MQRYPKPKPYRPRQMKQMSYHHGMDGAVEGMIDVAKIGMIGGMTVGILGAFKQG